MVALPKMPESTQGEEGSHRGGGIQQREMGYLPGNRLRLIKQVNT